MSATGDLGPLEEVGLRRNVHCSNCGDTRGGPFGHEAGECTYRRPDPTGIVLVRSRGQITVVTAPERALFHLEALVRACDHEVHVGGDSITIADQVVYRVIGWDRVASALVLELHEDRRESSPGPHSPKMIIEALRISQARISESPLDEHRKAQDIDRLQHLIDQQKAKEST